MRFNSVSKKHHKFKFFEQEIESVIDFQVKIVTHRTKHKNIQRTNDFRIHRSERGELRQHTENDSNRLNRVVQDNSCSQ